MVKLEDVKSTIAKDQGWHGFAIAHDMKIGYFMTFKVFNGNIFKITICDLPKKTNSRIHV
jgi:hypothetical protein